MANYYAALEFPCKFLEINRTTICLVQNTIKLHKVQKQQQDNNMARTFAKIFAGKQAEIPIEFGLREIIRTI